jgi:hypothetical protein
MEKPHLCYDFHAPLFSRYCLHCGDEEEEHERRKRSREIIDAAFREIVMIFAR